MVRVKSTKRSGEGDNRNIKFRYEAFCVRFLQFREKTWDSQAEAAAQNGLKPRAWSFYEKGTRDAPLSLLEGLARKGLNLNWLFTGEEGMRRTVVPPVTPGFPKAQIVRGAAVAAKARGVFPMDEGDFGILVASAAEFLLLGLSEDEALEKINPAALAYRDRAIALGLFPGPGENSGGLSR